MPEGSKVPVGDNGDVTVTYPDGSKNITPEDKVVEGKSDADKNDPKVPGDKVKVDDPTKLTDAEKGQVKNNVEKANPGTTVEVDDHGNVTLTCPDQSTDTIPGTNLVAGKMDAKKTTPNLPTTKIPVQDPSYLTPAEQAAVQANVVKANTGAVVTVDAYGNATLTYPDGSWLTIKADQLVKLAAAPTGALMPSSTSSAPASIPTKPVKAATLPQTGDANTTALALSGLTLALIGLIGAKKKRSEEN